MISLESVEGMPFLIAALFVGVFGRSACDRSALLPSASRRRPGYVHCVRYERGSQ